MLSISPSQMAMFEAKEQLRFEQHVVDHLGATFPQRVAAMSAEALRELTRLGIAGARRHGLTAERDMAIYTGVAMVLGAAFDEDLRFGWAQEILSDPFIGSPALRADLLHEQTVERLKAETSSNASPSG